MAAVRPIKESAPYSRMRSAPIARAALPLKGRIKTNSPVSGGIPNARNRGVRSLLIHSIAPEARSMVIAVSSRISVGINVNSSFSPSAAPVSSRS